MPPVENAGAEPEPGAGTEQGPSRRSVVAAGLGTVALSVTGLSLLGAGPAAAGPATAAGIPQAAALAAARRAGSWHRYVQAPAKRLVLPVRTVGTTGDVSHEDALLKRGGGVTVLRRPGPRPRPAGPRARARRLRPCTRATTATTASRAPMRRATPSTGTRTPSGTTTPGRLPRHPDDHRARRRDAGGLTLVSNSDGVPTAFTVETWQDDAWQNRRDRHGQQRGPARRPLRRAGLHHPGPDHGHRRPGHPARRVHPRQRGLAGAGGPRRRRRA